MFVGKGAIQRSHVKPIPVIRCPYTAYSILRICKFMFIGIINDPSVSGKFMFIRIINTALADEYGTGWSELVQAPVRTPLQLCNDDACFAGCGRFHPAVEEPATPVVIDVWGRQFQLLKCSGVGGVYFEPWCSTAARLKPPSSSGCRVPLVRT